MTSGPLIFSRTSACAKYTWNSGAQQKHPMFTAGMKKNPWTRLFVRHPMWCWLPTLSVQNFGTLAEHSQNGKRAIICNPQHITCKLLECSGTAFCKASHLRHGTPVSRQARCHRWFPFPNPNDGHFRRLHGETPPELGCPTTCQMSATQLPGGFQEWERIHGLWSAGPPNGFRMVFYTCQKMVSCDFMG